MRRIIKEKDGKYTIKHKITLGDILLVLITIGLICLIAIITEV